MWQDSLDFVTWFRKAGYDETCLNDGVVNAMFEAWKAGKAIATPKALNEEDDSIFDGGIRQEIYGR